MTSFFRADDLQQFCLMTCVLHLFVRLIAFFFVNDLRFIIDNFQLLIDDLHFLLNNFLELS